MWKKYAFLSGLWRHKKICKISKQSLSNNILQKLINDCGNDVNSGNSGNITALTNLVMTVVQCNIELQKQNNEYQARNMELSKNNAVQYNTVISNNNNKTFNLNFFLNEQCKNAMNMGEFVDTFKLHLNDLEHVGKQGYIDGISEIIIKKLNEMDIYKRPIHCSDAKRETIFVKDADEAKPGNTAAFLVDSDDGFIVREVAQVVDEFAKLLRGFDIPAKEDEAAGLQRFKATRRIRIKFRPGYAGKEKLS